MHLGMSGSFRVERGERDRSCRRSTTSGRSSPRTTTSSSRSTAARASSSTTRAASARWIWSQSEGTRRAIRCSASSASSRCRRNSTPPSSPPLLAGARTPLKTALLDQKRIAGLGNIYVCEALHRARVCRRLREAGSLADAKGKPTPPRVRWRGDPRRARGGDRSGRLDAARPSPARRRTRLFPALLRRLRPRRRRLPAHARCRGTIARDRPERALDVLLSGVPEIARAKYGKRLLRACAAPAFFQSFRAIPRAASPSRPLDIHFGFFRAGAGRSNWVMSGRQTDAGAAATPSAAAPKRQRERSVNGKGPSRTY